MSGGSFNYLGDTARWGDLWTDRNEDLVRMLKALEEYGPPAAKALSATRSVIILLADARAAAAALADVWQAVEWHHSRDWDRDQVLEALAAHTRAEAAGIAQVPPPAADN